MRELYRMLEVEPTADFDTIRESYRRLLKRYHPDSGGSDSDPARLELVIDAFRRLKTMHPEASARVRAPRRPANAGGTPRSSTAKPGGAGRSAGKRQEAADRNSDRAAGRSAAAAGKTTRRSQDVFRLGRMLTRGPSVSTRTFAARSLGNLGKRSAYTFLKQGLSDPEEQVVVSCLRSIGRLKIAQAAGDLSSLFSRADANVRRVIMETVAEIDRLQLFRTLIRAGLEDADAAVRQRALKLFLKLER